MKVLRENIKREQVDKLFVIEEIERHICTTKCGKIC